MPDLAQRVEEARRHWNDGDLDAYLTLYDEGVRVHGYGPEPMDKSAAAGFYRMIWSGLADVDKDSPGLEIHEVLVDGNLYSCRFTMTGVHSGDFMGNPPTGRPYSLGGITIMRFNGDRVVERWSNVDFLGLLMQIGALPPPE
jgi:predicted ester cyclase